VADFRDLFDFYIGQMAKYKIDKSFHLTPGPLPPEREFDH
jgi:hypothetical protein